MKKVRLLKNALLVLPFLLLLAGCGSREVTQREPGVEDLTPGEKSVISAPARLGSSPSGVQERNI